MAKLIGKVGNTLHYADTTWPGLSRRALHIKVTPYEHSDTLVFVEDIGKVSSTEAAEDKVAAIVKRELELLALLKGSQNDDKH